MAIRLLEIVELALLVIVELNPRLIALVPVVVIEEFGFIVTATLSAAPEIPVVSAPEQVTTWPFAGMAGAQAAIAWPGKVRSKTLRVVPERSRARNITGKYYNFRAR